MSRASRQREADALAAAKRKAAEKAAAEARALEEALKTGRTGSMEDFNQMSSKKGLSTEVVDNLLKGATQAFLEDNHPQKIQYILSDWSTSYHKNVLLGLTTGKDSEQALAAVNLAVDNLSKEKRQAVLDEVLFKTVAGRDVTKDYVTSNVINKSEEDLIGVLLQAKANPNAFEGHTFARAIAFRSIAVVKLLRAHGAEYKDARLYMQVYGWERSSKSLLRYALADLNAYEGHENAEPMAKLRENVDNITADVRNINADLEAARAAGVLPSRNNRIRPASPAAQ